MRSTPVLVCLALSLVAGSRLDAQWLKLPTPGLPRLADGKPDLAAPAPRTREGQPDFSGLWKNDAGDRLYNNVAVDLSVSDVAPWAHTLFMKRSLEFGKDSMESQCLPLGPAYMTTRYREYRIIQTPTLIVFVYDDGMHREIFMDGRMLEPDPNPTWMGYSVGHWDGDTLVVESNGYTDRSWLDFGGHPHSEELRITERYTRPSIGRISVQVTMVDPRIYAKPITLTVPVKLRADTEMLEGYCENNKSRERMTATPPAEVVSVPAATLASYVGTYDTEDDGDKHVVKVTVDARNDLWFNYDDAGQELLLALSPTRFSWSGSLVEFAPGPGGAMAMAIHYVESTERGQRRSQSGR